MKKNNSKSAINDTVVAATEHVDITREQTAAEQPKARIIKMVAIFIASQYLTTVTEKAQLITLPTEDNASVKVWLPKSLISLSCDGESKERTLCRMPAWLYFRKELNKFFPDAEWSTKTIPAEPEDVTMLPMADESAPLIKQYREMKRKHPDAVLLFRCGDFYETFADDAIVASDILGITLTRRADGKLGRFVELAGFPHHALDSYLPKLVRAGKRVAICEQLDSCRR